MIESVIDNILIHTRAHFPEEACGLVAIRKGKTKFYPCENKAADPLIDFSIDCNIGSINSNYQKSALAIVSALKYYAVCRCFFRFA